MGYFEELAIDSAQFWKKPSTKKDSENPGWYLGNQRFKLTDRYSSNQYISQLQSKNQQAVIKIVSHACGKSQITRVFDYIGREGEKDSIGFEDDQGKSYNTKEDRESLIKEWSENFISKEKYKNQEWKLTKLHDLEEEKERLEFKKDRESFLDTNKQDRLDDLNKFIEGKYYIDSEGKKTNLK
ncbi:MAG: hypothetical protein HOJ35_00305, partial [Bdellovibrionales bacterium]|nr:hypothetical protein [Bdellovibrionales bacterium]